MRKIIMLGFVLGALSACMNTAGTPDTMSSNTNDNLTNPTDGMENELETE